jgi:hypothetical protein
MGIRIISFVGAWFFGHAGKSSETDYLFGAVHASCKLPFLKYGTSNNVNAC